MKEIKILGIPVKQINKKQLLGLIEEKINRREKLHIVTVNPEILVSAQKENEFKKILRQSFNIPDAVGIMWAGYYLSKTNGASGLFGSLKKLFWLKWSLILTPFWQKKFKIFPEKLSGSDIFWDILKLADKKRYKIMFLGADEGVAQMVANKMRIQFKNLKIVGAIPGSAKESDDEMMQKIVNNAEPQIIFAAYGSPKQEYWIARNLPYFKNSLITIGVGGTFDFVAGKAKRAPKILRSLGLEWLWRLIQEPKKRFKRIINAVFIFPWLVFRKH